MLRLRPTYEEIAREARTHRLKILPERQKRTQQGILLDDVDFNDFDLDKYDKKTMLMNENPQKGTQTDNFNVSSSVSESENMKTPKEAVKQIEEETQSNALSSKESDETEEREMQQEPQSLMRRLYNSLFEEVEAELPISNQPSTSSETPLPNKKESPLPSDPSSSRRSSTSRSNLLPIAETSSVEEVISVQDSNPLTVESSSNRTIEYVDDASEKSSRANREATPPQSVISSRRSQETIEYIRSRTSSRRTSVQSVSSS